MKKKMLIALMVCALASAAVYGAWAQDETYVGVKEGDNFTYHFEVLWSSTDPSATVPQMFSDLNQTFSIHFNVTEVGSSIVFVDITNNMMNGTQASTAGFVNVLDGRGTGDAQLFIIAANLTAGDQVYSMSDPTAVAAGAAAEPFTITDTATKTYLGASKTVNHYTKRVTNATTGDFTERGAYYDKKTGILLELTLTFYDATYQETDSEHWMINQFNSVVTAPDGTDGTTNGNSNGAFPEWLVPVVIAVVIVIIAVFATMVMLMRRRKPQEQESPPTSQQTSPDTPI